MPRRTIRAAATVLALSGAIALPASAQEAPAAQQPAPAPATPGEPSAPAASPAAPQVQQVPLTAEAVEKFISSWPAIETLGDELADAYGVDQGVTDPTSAFLAWNKRPEAKAKIDEALSKAGFGSLGEWVRIANSIVVAYNYDEAELAPERLEAIVAEIQASPEIPDDQKAAVIAQVRQEFARAAALKPLPGNSEVVAPFADRLAEVFGEGSMEGEMVVPDDGEAPDEAPAEDDPAAGAPPADAPPAPAPAQ